MKNCNTLFIGNRKLDTWPRVGLPAGAPLGTRMNQTPPQRSSHTCYVISEEPHFEPAADSCGEVAVMNGNIRNGERTRQLTRGESSFGHGEGRSTASTVLRDFISNRSRSAPQHNLNISSGHSLEKSNVSNFSDQSKRCLAIPEQPERLPEAPQHSRGQRDSRTNQQRADVSDSCDNARESEWIRDDSELKSGSLVLIVQCYDHSNGGRVAASEGPSSASRNGCAVQRFPVLVKIYQNCERYAIVMRTRRHQSTPSLYIKLKKCSVVRSTTDPSHFVVMVGGHDGKSYRFEASSTKSADEWMRAFSGDVTPWYKSSVQHETRRDAFPEVLSRPVNENDDPSLLPPSPPSANPTKTVSRKVHKIPLRPMPSLSESSDEDTS